MKALLLAALCCLLTLTAHAQAPWPRSSKTGKVEFRGTLPWPKTAKTDAQRRALVRRWYLAKLTDQTAAAVQQNISTAASTTLLTYDKLPSSTVLRYGEGPQGVMLAYWVTLDASSRGIAYVFSEFDWQKSGEAEPGNTSIPIEKIIEANAPADAPALSAVRKRLAVAVAGW